MVNRIVFIAAVFLCSTDSFSFESVADEVETIQAYRLIGNISKAQEIGAAALQKSPDSIALKKEHLRTLAKMGMDEELLSFFERSSFDLLPKNEYRNSLEELAWGILETADQSDILPVKVLSLLGASFTGDVRAIPLIRSALRNQNGALRVLGVQLASRYGDIPLRKELSRLLREEPLFFVRLEVIQAIGQLRMEGERRYLLERIESSQVSMEEMEALSFALAQIYDDLGEKELKRLAESRRVGLRLLAAQLILFFEKRGEGGEILRRLIQDHVPAVRALSLYALGFLGEEISSDELEKCLKETVPEVSITAAWVALMRKEASSEEVLRRWLYDSREEIRSFAAAVLGTVKSGKSLALQEVKKHPDGYVRLNLAMALLGQKKEKEALAEEIFQIFSKEKDVYWMWKRVGPFQFITPTTLSHHPLMPNYPAVVDQFTRLDLLSALAIIGFDQAEEALHLFVEKKGWGVSAAASATLLQEGSQEALDLVRSLLKVPDRSIRVQAALILAFVGSDSSALPILIEAYPGADREMKIKILEAIGGIGSFEAVPFLREALKEPFQILRTAAAFSLIRVVRS